MVDVEDYDWLVAEGKWTAFQCGGPDFYAGRKSKSLGLLMMSRRIMKTPSNLICDHIHGDTLDNRKEFLQNVTRGQNRRNKHNLQLNNKSGFEGVWYSTSQNKWLAYITNQGQRVHLGSFILKSDALQARLAAVAEYHGDSICQTSRLHQSSKQYLEQLLQLKPIS